MLTTEIIRASRQTLPRPMSSQFLLIKSVVSVIEQFIDSYPMISNIPSSVLDYTTHNTTLSPERDVRSDEDTHTSRGYFLNNKKLVYLLVC